jgi:hypothetical protein
MIAALGIAPRLLLIQTTATDLRADGAHHVMSWRRISVVLQVRHRPLRRWKPDFGAAKLAFFLMDPHPNAQGRFRAR